MGWGRTLSERTIKEGFEYAYLLLTLPVTSIGLDMSLGNVITSYQPIPNTSSCEGVVFVLFSFFMSFSVCISFQNENYIFVVHC